MTATATSTRDSAAARTPPIDRLPVLTLLSLAVVGVALVSMETMPAGLLPVMAASLGTDEGMIGLFVSAYALGTVTLTIPAIALTRGFRRKPLLLVSIAGLVVMNSLTAFSDLIPLLLISRFLAGAFSGIIWGMFAPYARSISPKRHAGRSLAIIATGAPIGFAVGTPAGAWLGTVLDWRAPFWALSIVAALAGILIAVLAPDVAGRATNGARRSPLHRVLRIPGILIILAVIATWMLAHNTIYTYIAPYLRDIQTGIRPDLMLLVYGVSSVIGIVVTGTLLDRHPRSLLHTSVAAFIVAGVILLVGDASVTAVLLAAALWGLAFGGASAQLQAALTNAGGENADIASSFLPVAFNVAIFAAGILGAALLTTFDGMVLPVVMLAGGVVALALTIRGRRTAFPALNLR